MSIAAGPSSRPAWQTDELEDEWIEPEAEDDDEEQFNGTRSISFTAPLSTQIHTINDISLPSPSSSAHSKGTFLVHQSVPNLPLLPKTPGRNKTQMKNFFSPMPLERLFEPPSPPHSQPIPLTASSSSDEIIETDVPNMISFDGRKPSLDCQFTFSAPRDDILTLGNRPQAESTPGNAVQRTPNAPSTDPPLRLFQFQYDTYTRDHLSAMVDSIAVNPALSSGATNSPASLENGLSRVSEATGSLLHSSDLRSAKRIKLSPKSDFEERLEPQRPKLSGKDYVGESRSLMQQIKQARDFSTISTVASVRDQETIDLGHPSLPADPAPPKTGVVQSSTKFRLQAATLMAQIKNDMKGQKRIFSADNESCLTSADTSAQTDSRRSPRLTISNSSPRRSLRQSTTQRQAEDLARNVSKISLTSPASPRRRRIPAGVQVPRIRVSSESSEHLAPPSVLSTTHSDTVTASSAHEDLRRFVSSSTASSGTTLTASSVPSFSKHPGPTQIRTIAPSEVPPLDRLGNMMFDKVMMKWVKSSAQIDGEYLPPEEVSEDPFGDIESLKDDSKLHESSGATQELDDDPGYNELSRVEERSEIDDTEEMELTSFETDDPNGRIVDVISRFASGDDTTDSEDDIMPPEPIDPVEYDSEGEEDEKTQLSPKSTTSPSHDIPDHPIPSSSSMRSAMKVPASVLKDTSGARYRTPQRKSKHRRSVSFSDGKQDGPIRGLGKNAEFGDLTIPGDSRSGFVPSARSKRIADMMVALEDSDYQSEESPSKSYGSSDRPLANRTPSTTANLQAAETSRVPRRVFSRSPRFSSSTGSGNATFLTECSFGVAHDRLVQVITDVEPFEPHWEGLYSIDLSGKNIESVARLKEFLPRLDCLKLNSNLLSWLSGVPGSVRTLSVACNSLTGLTSYHHLLNLENLDISRNDVESLTQLSCLRHLRELKADWNRIGSLEGLERLDGLVKLSVQGNRIRSVDIAQYRWTRLEMLNVSENRLDNLVGLASLPSLIALNVDSNSLETLDLDGSMPRLKILRASGNRLTELDTGFIPNIRTLYLDNNSLKSLVKVERLGKLENLSLRNQSGKGYQFVTRDVRDVKRLYLSGNALGKQRFLTESCYNLVYLELAACRLTVLPEGLAGMVPNVRVLNLNYNFLEDARPLAGLTRLQKLTIIGSRLKGTKALIRLLQRMPEVEMLDFRMNPCTLGWYLPLLVKDVPGALQPSEDGPKGGGGSRSGWKELDAKFRRDLPNDSYIGRLAYRGLVMQACPRIRMLDGIEVTEKERLKAEKILEGILGERRG
ncbi:hypothetical protein GYMLUDRAFT_212772 [Collybiopsis luxurians FD-317 M1]|nr:hypothetical protein GYMLUDRAFT_212772 [Collybiopsis luxurians FD-317 M1]